MQCRCGKQGPECVSCRNLRLLVEEDTLRELERGMEPLDEMYDLHQRRAYNQDQQGQMGIWEGM